MRRKYHQVNERQIELQEGPNPEMLILTISDMDDNLLFSAAYIDEATARAAYRLAYNAVVNDLPLERIYGT